MAKLAEKQEKVLLELLAGKSRAECARLAEVGESTIYTWLNDPSFRERLKDAQARVFNEAAARLHGLAGLAVDTIARGMGGKATAVEVRTANALFGHLARFRELELIERIERLEKIFEGR